MVLGNAHVRNVRENFSRVVAFGHPSPATVLAHPVSTISGTLDGVRCSCTVHHVVHIDVGVAHTSPVPLKVVPVMLPIGLFATKSAQVAKSLTEQSVGNVVASVFVSEGSATTTEHRRQRPDNRNGTDTPFCFATTRLRRTASSDVVNPGRATAAHFEASKCYGAFRGRLYDWRQ